MKMRCTQAELSRRLRCSEKTISKHLHRPDAPQRDGDGKYDALEVEDYIREARKADNATPARGDLLAQKIEKLRLENETLRRALKMDRPTLAVEEVAGLLAHFLIECRHAFVGAMNNHGVDLVNQKEVGVILNVLNKALHEGEDRVARWCDTHGLRVGNVLVPWPESASFAWWHERPSAKPTTPGALTP